MHNGPSVTIIVLNYNGIKNLGEKFLISSVSSILSSNYDNFELIFFDNGSTDQSASFVAQSFRGNSNLKVVVSKENLGFSLGNNAALECASGKYVAFLNNDVEVDPDWLIESVNLMEYDSSIGISQSKILNFDKIHVQTAGNVLDFALMTFCIGFPNLCEGYMKRYNSICEITYACGAAFIIRKSIVDRIGLFDSKYFFYHDDCDLGWRVRLAGFKVVLSPLSIVYHKGSITSSATFKKDKLFFMSFCSRVGLLLKNLEFKNLLRFSTIMSISMGLDFVKFIFEGDVTILRDFVVWNLKNFRHNWEKRLIVQNQIRIVKDNEILEYFLDLSIFVFRLRNIVGKFPGLRIHENLDVLLDRAKYNFYVKHIYNPEPHKYSS